MISPQPRAVAAVVGAGCGVDRPSTTAVGTVDVKRSLALRSGDTDGWGTPTMQTNLARLAEESLDRFGDYPSLFFEGGWHSSVSLHERGARVAAGLRRAGVRPGDR